MSFDPADSFLLRGSYSTALSTSTNVGSQVIGILFEKRGAEIKSAAYKRLKNLEAEREYWKQVQEPIQEKLKGKEEQLRKLDNLLKERNLERRAQLRPFQKRLEEIQSERDCFLRSFDASTDLLVGKEALALGEDLDHLETEVSKIKTVLDPIKTPLDRSRSHSSSTSSSSPSFVPSPIVPEQRSTMDLARERISIMRTKIREISTEVDSIQEIIYRLDQEIVPLKLIVENINEERDYKLDMEKLTAFGFND